MWVGSEKDRQSKHREYERHRRNYPKTDVEFLDANSRRNRILTTEDQLVSQCKKFIEIADRCEEKGEFCHIAFDREGLHVIPGQARDPPDRFFVHRHILAAEGVTKAEIRAREKVQTQLDEKFYETRNPKTRKKKRPQFERDSREKGLVKSDVFAFQFAALEDEENELVCAAHVSKIFKSLGGRRFPPQVRQVFSHKAVVISGLDIEQDVAEMNKAFFNDELEGIRCLELRDLVEAVMGKPLPKRHAATWIAPRERATPRLSGTHNARLSGTLTPDFGCRN